MRQYKNIFMKGTNPALSCPSAYFIKHNNIIIIIYCDNNQYDMVENIPLKGWFNFHFMLIIKMANYI